MKYMGQVPRWEPMPNMHADQKKVRWLINLKISASKRQLPFLTVHSQPFISFRKLPRITSYNVCYTKLLRKRHIPLSNILLGTFDKEKGAVVILAMTDRDVEAWGKPIPLSAEARDWLESRNNFV